MTNEIPMRAVTRIVLASAAFIFTVCCSLVFFCQPAYAAGEVVIHDAMKFQVTVNASEENDWTAEVMLVDDNNNDSAEVRLGEFEIDGARYRVTAIGPSAFKGNTDIRRVIITSDLTGESPAVGNSAFEGCIALERIEFPQKVSAIGNYAFKDCESLVDWIFPEGAVITTNSKFASPIIGMGAFVNCSSLQTLAIPALEATRSGDYYKSYEEYNTLVPAINDDTGVRFCSGYMIAQSAGTINPTASRPGFNLGSDGVFSGCSSLETLVFKAGLPNGAFAYFVPKELYTDSKPDESGRTKVYHFQGCDQLTSVVYESEKAYVADESCLWNSVKKDLYANLEKRPMSYYAVNYYIASSEDGTDDDDFASNRLARVEYAQGTAPEAIATNNNAAKQAALGNATVYASSDTNKYLDGKTDQLDPNEVAKQLDDYDESATYVWRLTDGQSRRAGLSDSCSAYLAKASDLSGGRVVSDALSKLYTYCDQNLSQGSIEDTVFDVMRFYNPGETIKGSTDNYTINADAYFTLTSDLDASFYRKLEVEAADGTKLEADQYTLTFQRYNNESSELLPAESLEVALAALGTDGGPLLMTIIPSEDSGYTSALREWVLVKGNIGSVMERFTDSSVGSSGTWYQATAKSETMASGVVTYTGPYAVQVGGNDLASALVATGFAGLAEAPINVSDSGKAKYGFVLARDFNNISGIIGSTTSDNSVSFPTDGDAAAFAVKAYQALKSDSESSARNLLGISVEDYPWGTTALLVDQSNLHEVAASAAALAYAAKAPVFYVGVDGTVSANTLECLADFERVILMGSTSTFTSEMVASLEAALDGVSVASGLTSSVMNASLLSRSVADYLIECEWVDAAVVTVSDAADPFDAIGALNRSGHSGGLTLVAASSADSKLTAQYLREKRDDISTVRLFGRTDGNALVDGYNLGTALQRLWDEQGGWAEPVVRSGDTLELSGMIFAVSGSGGTAESPFALTYSKRLWGSDNLAMGTYNIDGISYRLANGTAEPSSKDPSNEASSLIDLGSITEKLDSIWAPATKSQWVLASKAEKSQNVDNSTSSNADNASGATSISSGNTATGGILSSGTASGGTVTSSAVDPSTLNLNTQLENPDNPDGNDEPAAGGVSDVSSVEDDGSTEGESSADNPVINIGDITDTESPEEEKGAADDGDSADQATEGVSPAVVGLVVAAVVAALGTGAWLMLRRRNDELFEDELASAA